MRTATSTALRLLWLNLAVIAVTLGAFEVWAGTQAGGEARKGDSRPILPTYIPGKHIQVDGILGYGPIPGSVTRSRKLHGTTLLYDVKYTIGLEGLRISPPSRGGPLAACVLFFGDSFTFGEGLEDTQTLPYRVGEIGGGRFEVYNFGFHGYGPHHMLSALEHGRVASVLKCRPTHVIYSAIKDHPLRAAGRTVWSRRDPRYRLQPDGSVRSDGHFFEQNPTQWWRGESRRQLGKAALYRWISARSRGASKQELLVFTGIVAQARRIVESYYPGCVFEALLWDRERRAGDVKSALQGAGLAPRIVEDLLPTYHEDSASYYIPHDAHPSAKANDLLARYVVGAIIEAPRQP